MFLSWLDDESNDTNKLPLYKEIGWDFHRNEPLIENGEFKVVEGLEAVKVWVYKVLKNKRYAYEIFSWQYGNDFEELIGKQYSKALTHAECQRYMEECLLINPYILGIKNMQSSFDNGRLSVCCILETIYGSEETEVEVNV